MEAIRRTELDRKDGIGAERIIKCSFKESRTDRQRKSTIRARGKDI